MKLWKATAELIYLIAANDENEAYKIANDAWLDVRRDQEPSIWIGGEIKEEKQLPDDWTVDCIPYGSFDDREVGEYLDAVVWKDTNTIDMFEAKQ